MVGVNNKHVVAYASLMASLRSFNESFLFNGFNVQVTFVMFVMFVMFVTW